MRWWRRKRTAARQRTSSSRGAGWTEVRWIYRSLKGVLVVMRKRCRSGGKSQPKFNGGNDGGMRDLEEMLSKLNPMAEEFVPMSLGRMAVAPPHQMKKHGFANGKRRMNTRTSMAQRDDVIRTQCMFLTSIISCWMS